MQTPPTRDSSAGVYSCHSGLNSRWGPRLGERTGKQGGSLRWGGGPSLERKEKKGRKKGGGPSEWKIGMR